jgi:hypothetical protein
MFEAIFTSSPFSYDQFTVDGNYTAPIFRREFIPTPGLSFLSQFFFYFCFRWEKKHGSFFFFFFFRCRSRSRNQNFEYELDYQWSQTTLIKTLLISISAIMSSAEVHVRIRGRPKYKKVEPLLSSPQWGVWSERLPLKWLFYIPNPSRDQDKKRDPCLLQRLILQPVSDSMSLANDTIAKNKVSVKKLKVIGGKLWTMRNQRSACSVNVDQKWTASKETLSFLVAIRVHFARRVQSTNFFRFNNRLVFTIAINWSRSMMRNRSLSLKKKKS